jgi:SAM-dependent methyltransferase
MDLRERGTEQARHPWESARAKFFGDVITRLSPPPGASVLDIGAGDGWLAEQLDGTVLDRPLITCWDIHYSEDDIAEVSGRVTRTRDEPEGEFDLVLVLDVLEHVADDSTFVGKHVLPHVRPGGHVVVSVPAHPLLYTEHDRMLAHERRYRVKEIHELLERFGRIIREGSLFTTLLMPRAVERVLDSVRHRPATGIGAWNGGPGLTRCVETVLNADARVNGWFADRKLRLPGLSYWAVVVNADGADHT